MPIIESTYKPPQWLENCHIQTIFGGYLRSAPPIKYKRERIETPDGDFLDLDWSTPHTNSKKLVILSHGLTGNSKQAYVIGMACSFQRRGWNALAWNFRGCSEELNRKAISYHLGWTYDLEIVIEHAAKAGNYEEIVLLGFNIAP